MGFNTKKEKRAKYDFYDFSLFLCRNGSRHRNRVCRHECGAVISPMLITFLGMDPYQAVGIALASDVLASAVSAYTYGKNKNLDVANGIVMMVTVLFIYAGGRYIASLLPSTTMGGFSMVMTLPLGVKFIVKPVMTTKKPCRQSQKEAFYPVCDLRHADRIYLRLCRSGRRTDDASDPDKCAWL